MKRHASYCDHTFSLAVLLQTRHAQVGLYSLSELGSELCLCGPLPVSSVCRLHLDKFLRSQDGRASEGAADRQQRQWRWQRPELWRS